MGKKQGTKTMLICVAAIVISLAVFLVIAFRSSYLNNLNKQGSSEIEEEANAEASGLISGLTFEDFTYGMRDDLSDEQLQEVERIYDETMEAYKAGDIDRANELTEELYEMQVFEDEFQDLYNK